MNNFTKLTLIFVCQFGLTTQVNAQVTEPVKTVSIHSSEGTSLLLQCKSKSDYFMLSTYFTTQDNLAYCGPASATMVLNALGVERPKSSKHRGYHLFDQTNFFSEEVSKVISSNSVRRTGMTLEQLSDAIGCHSVECERVHCGDIANKKFKESIVAAVEDPNQFVIANYLRSSIGQKTGGHISPVAAYDEGSQKVLMLDVSRYKYPPVWVNINDLIDAMNTEDSSSKKNRGIVICRNRQIESSEVKK